MRGKLKMEMYYQRGESREDCELKIREKYKTPFFHIQTVKDIRVGGFWGMFSKPGVEVGFYFYPLEQKRKSAAGSFEEEKRKVIAAAGKTYEQVIMNNKETSPQPAAQQAVPQQAVSQQAMSQILDSINELKEKITGKEEHPAFTAAAELLKLNDFSEKYINKMIERMRKELPLDVLENMEAVQERLLEWIGESINIYKEDSIQRKPKIMILVGPTGVGKTTTIAKLAAIFGIQGDDFSALNVRMITIDVFRIGAKEQLETYGDLMQIPVSCVDNSLDLKKEIALYSEETDLFLIDTIGKSPKDLSKLGEMKEILESCLRRAETHLVMSAGTKTSDIEDILRQFEPFNYKSVLLTKMDETDHIGNVISALEENKKQISYITTGQAVPDDIMKATVVRFLINLDCFKVDREKIEKRFPSGEAEQFKWK